MVTLPAASTRQGRTDGPAITVCTIDSFQSDEAAFFILDPVVTAKLDFVDDRNRLNVAFSRARYGIVIVGDVRAISAMKTKHTSTLLAMPKDLRTKGFMITARGALVISNLLCKQEKYCGCILVLLEVRLLLF